ncbi:unnamed protein product, partial [marine sediment metagenome]
TMKEIELPPEPPSGRANLTGLIRDDGSSPISGVSVNLNDHRATTSGEGIFNFLDIELGDYRIDCTKAGYESYKDYITLTEGNNRVDIEMAKIVGKRDPLDTLIMKMEEVRPTCPIRPVEETWVRFTEKVIEATPSLKILPPER